MTGMDTFASIVDGRDLAGTAGERAVASPAGGPSFARVGLLSADEAGGALDAARRAFPAWSALSFAARARHLQAVRALLAEEADAVASLLTREQGKPAGEAHAAEIFPSLEALKHLAAHAEDVLRETEVEPQTLLLAHKECRLLAVPYGVVLVITPWNYPF
jgi:succinate-semialdehyde dehydrogenase/glutarate-semialdehyde dehydrogenase